MEAKESKGSKRKVWLAVGALALLLAAASLAYNALAPEHAPEAVPAVPEAVPESAEASAEEERPYAPDFPMRDMEGNALRLSEFLGEKPAVVNFWASWCPPCRAELPYFDAACLARGEEIYFLMVDLADGVQETEQTAKDFLAENGYRFPAYFVTTGEAVSAYQLYSIPVTVAIDREGRIVSARVGALSEEGLAALLDAISA